MGEPARKLPADWEPDTAPEAADPFRYGWRWQTVRLPNGKVTEQQIPLTAEDLLDPQLGDEVPQSIPHSLFIQSLASLLRLRYRSRPDVLVVNDVKMLWGIPGLKEPSPDIAVIPGLRTRHDLHELKDRRSFDVVREGTRPALVIELVSPPDPALRRNDYEDKVKIYQEAGVPEYLILDPPFSRPGCLELTAYRLGPGGLYRRIKPDVQGRVLSETTGLLFGVDADAETLLVFDSLTGERLFIPDDQLDRETEARKAAEGRADREAEARKAADERAAREAEARKTVEERANVAEAEIARLRAELDKARNTDR
ncbi:MAG: Uma2 family endonuclease [Acidobacteria bacterium]|nr:Uma2 family endonuclease [Acidobacteriota bacterium]